MVILHLTFWRTPNWFSTVAAPFTFLPATYNVEGTTAVRWFSFPLSFLLLGPLLTLFPLISYFLRGLQVLFMLSLLFTHQIIRQDWPKTWKLTNSPHHGKSNVPGVMTLPPCGLSWAPWTITRWAPTTSPEPSTRQWAACLIPRPHPLLAAGPPAS